LLERGEIDDSEAIVMRALAYQKPEALPAALQSLAPNPVSCATPVLLNAYQARLRNTLSFKASQLDQTRAGRPSSAGYIESTQFPVRVHYVTASLADMAQEVLDAVDYSWQKETVNMGFLPPMGDFGGSGEGGSADYDFYVGDAEGAAGYTMPESSWPDTAWSDCTSYIVIDRTLPTSNDIKTTVAHELNHAMQMAYDCGEWDSLYENTSSYIMEVVYDSVNDYIYYLPEFQQNPGYPFERFSWGDLFQYGGFIVAAVIDEGLGNGDGNKIREVWENCKQNSDYNNEPDFLDVVDDQMGLAGGGLDGFQQMLAEWKYLTGTRSDGAHLSEAGTWDDVYGNDTQPPDAATHALSTLPVNKSVTAGPHVHGAAYVRVAIPSGTNGTLYLSFDGAATTRWALNLICWGGSGQAQVTPIEMTDTTQANVGIPVSGKPNCTLAIANLGPTNYDVDRDYQGIASKTYSYSYGLDFVIGALGAPTIASVSPETVDCAGEAGVTVNGSNFYQGSRLLLNGLPARILSLTRTSFTFTAPGRTESGRLPLVFTNADGQAVTTDLLYLGGSCSCECDQTEHCETACACDVECLTCACDTSSSCDSDCDCDPKCDDEGCNAVPNNRPEFQLAIIGLGGLGGLARSYRRRRLPKESAKKATPQ